MEMTEIFNLLSEESQRRFWNHDNSHILPMWKRNYAKKMENHLWVNDKNNYLFYFTYEINGFILLYKINHGNCGVNVERVYMYDAKSNLILDKDGKAFFNYKENFDGYKAIRQGKEFKRMKFLLKKVILSFIEDGRMPSPNFYDRLDNHVIKTIETIIKNFK